MDVSRSNGSSSAQQPARAAGPGHLQSVQPTGLSRRTPGLQRSSRLLHLRPLHGRVIAARRVHVVFVFAFILLLVIVVVVIAGSTAPRAALRRPLLLDQRRQQLRHALLQLAQGPPEPAQLGGLALLRRRVRHSHRPRPPVAAPQLRYQMQRRARVRARRRVRHHRAPLTCPRARSRAGRPAPPRADTPPPVTWGARHSASAVAPPGASSAPRFPLRFALLGLRGPAMEAAALEGAEPGSGGSGAEEPVVSLAEVLAENEELEKEARAVLGGSDHERCSYSQGAVKRQALYACSTCTPPGAEPAGICLACSYECHGTHRLFELYTKRNFRCDCGNSKFKNLQCKLLPEKGKVNSGNKYNDNFYGLYCTCKRPYPDPEDEIPDEMIQCIVCEDWFHGRHLGAIPPESGDFHEMVCQACMNHCHFLWAYASQLAVPPLTKPNSLEDEGIVLKVEETEEQKKEIKKESGVEHQDTKEEKQLEQFNEPSTSSGSACPEVVTKSEEPVCKLKELQSKPFVKKDTATFWPSNWRSKLCTCEDCLKMYSELEVQFLTDECDTVLAYENKGTSDQETERRDPLMDTLNSMNRVQQVELICEYNDLKTELTDYLRRFADEGTVVKREDIQNFFEEFQSRKRRRTNRMQYYCS